MRELEEFYIALGQFLNITDDLSIKELKELKQAIEVVRFLIIDLIMRKIE